jgi:hypothetical protein
MTISKRTKELAILCLNKTYTLIELSWHDGIWVQLFPIIKGEINALLKRKYLVRDERVVLKKILYNLDSMNRSRIEDDQFFFKKYCDYVVDDIRDFLNGKYSKKVTK